MEVSLLSRFSHRRFAGFPELWASCLLDIELNAALGYNFFTMSFQADYQAFFPFLFILCKPRHDRKERDLEEQCKCQTCCVDLLHSNEIQVWILTLSNNSFFPSTQGNTQKIRLNRAIREKWGTSSTSSLSIILRARQREKMRYPKCGGEN